MTRSRVRLLYLLAAGLLCVPIAVTEARGHGLAEWIQNGGYHNAQNIHCCGPSDCVNAGQVDVHRVEGGWKFIADVDGQPTELYAPDGNTFVSQDANVWFCIGVQGKVDKIAHCLFIPGSV